jgi:hypothetical protein
VEDADGSPGNEGDLLAVRSSTFSVGRNNRKETHSSSIFCLSEMSEVKNCREEFQ